MKFSVFVIALIVATPLYAAKHSPVMRQGEVLPDLKLLDKDSCGNIESPWLVFGDFDGDGKPDEAMIVESAAGKLKLVVALHYKSRPKFIDLMEIGSGPARQVLAVSKGPEIIKETETVNHQPGAPESVSVKTDHFELVYCESASTAFYWDNEKKEFATIQTSD